MDPANITDADAFEELTQGVNGFIQTPDQLAIDEDLEVLDTPTQPTNQTNTGNVETTSSIVIIDRFPLGNAGAPISGMARGSSLYESYNMMHAGSVWAPFKSQCDWKFARWAKLRGPTSSAVNELLEISAVRTSHWAIFMLLIYE
jgi:hypothetical protein